MREAISSAGRAKFLFKRLNDRCLAISDFEAEALGIALRSCAPLRHEDRIFAAGSRRGGHACPKQGGLHAACAKLAECARTAQSEDPVLWGDQTFAACHEPVVYREAVHPRSFIPGRAGSSLRPKSGSARESQSTPSYTCCRDSPNATLTSIFRLPRKMVIRIVSPARWSSMIWERSSSSDTFWPSMATMRSPPSMIGVFPR